MGFVTIVIGKWKKKRRREMASQRRKGTTQPKSFLWRMRPAIHQLLPASACYRVIVNIGIMKERPSTGKTMCESEPRDSQGSCRGGKPMTDRIRKNIANLRCNIPRKKKEDKDVEESAIIHIESRESVTLPILFLFLNRTYMSPLLSVTTSKPILFRMMVSVELVALRVCVWDR